MRCASITFGKPWGGSTHVNDGAVAATIVVCLAVICLAVVVVDVVVVVVAAAAATVTIIVIIVIAVVVALDLFLPNAAKQVASKRKHSTVSG